MFKKIKRKIKTAYLESRYLYYFKKPIDEKMILLESNHGKNAGGNIFPILKEFKNNKKYSDYTVYLTVRKESINQIEGLLEKYNLNCEKVFINTKEYFRILSTAKYLVNDVTFPLYFIKKDEQVYLNTWHGTPLKTLGRSENSDYAKLGNIQKNFVVADYLLYPNVYTKDKITDGYMINDLTNAEYVLAEYPRNEILIKNNVTSIKKELGIENKKIYMYMPTWRGIVSKSNPKTNVYLQYYLYEIDKLLKDDEIMYVNLHHLTSKDINFSSFKNIKKFPSNFETYDFLKIGDVLITDYSSVMFDFSHTNKKCVLFVYDKREYLEERGLYINLEDLPFPQVDNVLDLMRELRNPDLNYSKHDLKTFIEFTPENITEKLLDLMLLNDKPKDLKIISSKVKDKDKVLVLIDNLNDEKVNELMLNSLEKIDLNTKKYFISFPSKGAKENPDFLKDLPIEVCYIPYRGKTSMSLFNKILLKLYNKKIIPYSILSFLNRGMYSYEIKRLFGNVEFTDVINFNGFGLKQLSLFNKLNINKKILLHGNIFADLKKKNRNYLQILETLKKSDEVLLAKEQLLKDLNKSKHIIDKKKIKIL